VGCEKEMIRELGGMRKVRLVRGMKRLIKSTRFGTRMKMRSRMLRQFLYFPFLI